MIFIVIEDTVADDLSDKDIASTWTAEEQPCVRSRPLSLLQPFRLFVPVVLPSVFSSLPTRTSIWNGGYSRPVCVVSL